MALDMTFQEFCVAERIKRQMTIKDFAKMVGVSHATIVKLENEDYTPTKLIMGRIFEKCGYDISEIRTAISDY